MSFITVGAELLAKRIEFRVGINVGDIIVEDSDVGASEH